MVTIEAQDSLVRRFLWLTMQPSEESSIKAQQKESVGLTAEARKLEYDRSQGPKQKKEATPAEVDPGPSSNF